MLFVNRHTLAQSFSLYTLGVWVSGPQHQFYALRSNILCVQGTMKIRMFILSSGLIIICSIEFKSSNSRRSSPKWTICEKKSGASPTGPTTNKRSRKRIILRRTLMPFNCSCHRHGNWHRNHLNKSFSSHYQDVEAVRAKKRKRNKKRNRDSEATESTADRATGWVGTG